MCWLIDHIKTRRINFLDIYIYISIYVYTFYESDRISEMRNIYFECLQTNHHVQSCDG